MTPLEDLPLETQVSISNSYQSMWTSILNGSGFKEADMRGIIDNYDPIFGKTEDISDNV